MRTTLTALWCGILITLAGSVSAQSIRSERLVSPRLDDWQIGYYRTNDEQMIREEVPHGQTVQDWRQMVTTQRFRGLAVRTTPAAYAQTVIDGMARACPGGRTTKPRAYPISGYKAVRFRADCPSNPAAGGTPETFLFLAIAGRTDMHVKQVAFRGGLGPSDLSWAERFISGVALCAEGDRAPACLR